MDKKKLLKVAKFLENLPKKNFDLKVLVAHGPNGIPTPEKALKGRTVACVVGWLPSIFPNDFQWDSVGVRLTGYREYNLCDLYAATEFLELTEAEGKYLFYDTSYPNFNKGPKHVANRIKKCVQKGFPPFIKIMPQVL